MLGEQRVGEQDPPRASKAGECRVGLLCPIAETPLEDAGDMRPGFIGQREQAIAKHGPRQRRDVVKQRHQDDRGKLRKQHEDHREHDTKRKTGR